MSERAPQAIELCCLAISSLEDLAEWVKQWPWHERVRVPGSYDTFREQVLFPNPKDQLWTQVEFDQIVEDLSQHPDVTYAEEAPPPDSS